MGGVGHHFRHYSADPGEFFHQVALCLQASGGVHDADVGIIVDGGFDSFVTHTGGIAFFAAGYNFSTHSLCPHRQLSNGGGAEGVAGPQYNRFSLLAKPVSEFGDRGCFTGSVNTHDHDHGRARGG